MRCGDCKHWQRVTVRAPDEDDEWEEPSPFGQCLRAKGEVQSWHEGYALDRYTLADERNAIPVDGSGYHAALITRDRFGCVDFEPTDSPSTLPGGKVEP